jgi:hypothetical protein
MGSKFIPKLRKLLILSLVISKWSEIAHWMDLDRWNFFRIPYLFIFNYNTILIISLYESVVWNSISCVFALPESPISWLGCNLDPKRGEGLKRLEKIVLFVGLTENHIDQLCPCVCLGDFCLLEFRYLESKF